MKILANKDIRDLFLALTLVLCALLLLTVGFMWLACRSFSLWLPLLFLLAGGAVWLLCLGYFKRQNRSMEQAVSQINAYLDGDRNARIECDNEGELYRLFHSINSLAAVLNAHADNEFRYGQVPAQTNPQILSRRTLLYPRLEGVRYKY